MAIFSVQQGVMLSMLMIPAIFAIASMFHGLTGIGVTLIATTALANFYPMSHVLLLTVAPCLVINLVVFLEGGNIGYYLKKYWLLVFTSFVGSLIGTKLVFLIAPHYLLIGLGLLIVGYVLTQFLASQTGKNIRLPNNQPSLIFSGLVAGVIGVATLLSLLCLYIGFYFRHKISQKMFKNMTLVILLLLGVNALFKAFSS